MEAVLKEKSIEGVDLSRLITFLQDLESAEPGVFSYSIFTTIRPSCPGKT